jgi:hypothetical protein
MWMIARTRSPSPPDVFVGSPVGRFVVGPTYLVWCESPDLLGAILWGELDDSSIRELMVMRHVFDRMRLATRPRVVVDCSRVTKACADALVSVTSFVRERAAHVSNRIERLAMVVPPGLAGILVAGVLPAAGIGHPFHVADDLASALAFVEHPYAAAAHGAAARAADEVRGTSTFLLRLRTFLAGHQIARPSAPYVARTLGMSTRTLYRELSRSSTSFADEVRRARDVTPRHLAA